MKIYLFVALLFVCGCSTYERVERHHYHDSPAQTTHPPHAAILLEPRPASTITIEIRR